MADTIYGLRIAYRNPIGHYVIGDYYGESREQIMDRFWQGRNKDFWGILMTENLDSYRKTDNDAKKGNDRRPSCSAEKW